MNKRPTRRYMVTIHDVGNVTDRAENVHTILTSTDYIAPRERVTVAPIDETCMCGGLGYLLEQSYGYTDMQMPEGWIPVQACDECRMFADDEQAAEAAARHSAMFAVYCYRDPLCTCEMFGTFGQPLKLTGTHVDDHDDDCLVHQPGDWYIWEYHDNEPRWPADYPPPTPGEHHVFLGPWSDRWICTAIGLAFTRLEYALAAFGQIVNEHRETP